MQSTYEYDALGRRIAKHVSRPFAPDEYFYYDGNRVVEHYKGSDASLSLHRQYVWGFDYIDELIGYCADGGSTPRFVLQDANYNVIAAAANNAGIFQQYSYEPHGDLFAAEDVLSDSGIPITIPVELPSQAIDLSTPFGFHGHMHDWETGKIHMRNRTYDPMTVRLLQRDPDATGLILQRAAIYGADHTFIAIFVNAIGQYEDGFALYLPFGSNPLTRADAMGLDWHHLVPVALGGDPNGPVVWLDTETHKRVNKFWSDKRLYQKRDQAGFWGKEKVQRGPFAGEILDDDKRSKLVRDSLVVAGIDVDDADNVGHMKDALRRASADRVPSKTPGGKGGLRIPMKRITAASDLPEVGGVSNRATREQLKRRTSPGGPRQAKRTYGSGGTFLAFAGAGIAMGIYSSDASASYAELVQLSQSIGRGGPSLYQEIEALDIIKDMNAGLGGNTFTIYYGWNYWREMHGAYTDADRNLFWAR
ncbi:MAG: hypothetical protein J5J06_04085 [Phycisphaerae bacterium]|nr:hypothetical protein [Phycisphaerae bacterium]